MVELHYLWIKLKARARGVLKSPTIHQFMWLSLLLDLNVRLSVASVFCKMESPDPSLLQFFQLVQRQKLSLETPFGDGVTRRNAKFRQKQ